MSLHDCEYCWSSPCECGAQWQHWDDARLVEMITLLSIVRDVKRMLPTALQAEFYEEMLKRRGGDAT